MNCGRFLGLVHVECFSMFLLSRGAGHQRSRPGRRSGAKGCNDERAEENAGSIEDLKNKKINGEGCQGTRHVFRMGWDLCFCLL